MNAVEEVAARYGESGAFLAAQGINKKWSMRREMRTPRYTTHWDDLPSVK